MVAWFLLVSLAVTCCVVAIIESWWHRRSLSRIPIRIHVNGTRGKSSVTRLIAAGLRAGGIRTCAKTTGTLPRMILCDGHEVPIYRPGRTNIIEQKRVVRAAIGQSADALVIECMALQPMLQSVCELKLVRSTHGVITNARADHLDVMGPTRLDVARALAGSISVGGQVFTAETRSDSLAVFAAAARDRRSTLHVIRDSDVADVTAAELSRFSYLEHADNVALALRVCTSVGVARETALSGMWQATPDSGAMRVYRVLDRSRCHTFVNAFAANDPESTDAIWHSVLSRYPDVAESVLVMNCRNDRLDRSITMADACAAWQRPTRFVVIGSGTEVFVRRLMSRGVPANQILYLADRDAESIRRTLMEKSLASSVIVGIGNVAGPGAELASAFQRRHTDESIQPSVAPVLVTPSNVSPNFQLDTVGVA